MGLNRLKSAYNAEYQQQYQNNNHRNNKPFPSAAEIIHMENHPDFCPDRNRRRNYRNPGCCCILSHCRLAIRLVITLAVIKTALAASTASAVFAAIGFNNGFGNQAVSANLIYDLFLCPAFCRFLSNVSVIVV